jgi:hypothetical protein
MKIINDPGRFDDRQIELLRWIAYTVKESLESAKVPKSKCRDITENITFQIACIIDGSTVMGIGADPLIPILTFAKDEEAKHLITAGGSGSWMHEYAIATAEEISDGDWKARSPRTKSRTKR